MCTSTHFQAKTLFTSVSTILHKMSDFQQKNIIRITEKQEFFKKHNVRDKLTESDIDMKRN